MIIGKSIAPDRHNVHACVVEELLDVDEVISRAHHKVSRLFLAGKSLVLSDRFHIVLRHAALVERKSGSIADDNSLFVLLYGRIDHRINEQTAAHCKDERKDHDKYDFQYFHNSSYFSAEYAIVVIFIFRQLSAGALSVVPSKYS